MNWVLIIVLLVLLLFIIRGYQKGLLRVVYSLVSWIIVLALVTWSTPFISNYLINHTEIYMTIEQRCEETLRQSSKDQEKIEKDATSQDLAALGINLPAPVLENLMQKTADRADEFLDESGIYTQIAQELASLVVDGIASFLALLFAWLVVHLISQILGIVSGIPVLRGVNKYMGLFAGGVYGLLLIWTAFYIVALCAGSELGGTIVSKIYESTFLTMLYENNLILTILCYFI